MKKMALLSIATLLFMSSTALSSTTTKPVGRDVLAICSNETGRVPLFEIIGQYKSFSGPRMTAQHSEVTIRNVATKAAFHGIVTLTKTTPYHFVLSGYSLPAKEGALSQNVLLYGTSLGKQLTIVKNTDNIDFKTYSCALSAQLLLEP